MYGLIWISLFTCLALQTLTLQRVEVGFECRVIRMIPMDTLDVWITPNGHLTKQDKTYLRNSDKNGIHLYWNKKQSFSDIRTTQLGRPRYKKKQTLHQ